MKIFDQFVWTYYIQAISINILSKFKGFSWHEAI